MNYLIRELGTAQVLWNSSESSYRLSPQPHVLCLKQSVFLPMLFRAYYRLVEAELKSRLPQDTLVQISYCISKTWKQSSPCSTPPSLQDQVTRRKQQSTNHSEPYLTRSDAWKCHRLPTAMGMQPLQEGCVRPPRKLVSFLQDSCCQGHFLRVSQLPLLTCSCANNCSAPRPAPSVLGLTVNVAVRPSAPLTAQGPHLYGNQNCRWFSTTK